MFIWKRECSTKSLYNQLLKSVQNCAFDSRNLNSLLLPQDGRTVTSIVLDGIVQRVAVRQEIWLKLFILFKCVIYIYIYNFF